jgi:hypothetical protein
MSEPEGASFGVAVKRTLEWSKILFRERKGIRATGVEALKRRDSGVPLDGLRQLHFNSS